MREEPESPVVLLVVAAALIVWAGISVGLTFFHLGGWETPVALTIAVVKASGIGLWFMELRHARVSVRVAILAAISLFVLLVGLTTLDVFTRAPAPLFVPDENFRRGG